MDTETMYLLNRYSFTSYENSTYSTAQKPHIFIIQVYIQCMFS